MNEPGKERHIQARDLWHGFAGDRLQVANQADGRLYHGEDLSFTLPFGTMTISLGIASRTPHSVNTRIEFSCGTSSSWIYPRKTDPRDSRARRAVRRRRNRCPWPDRRPWRKLRRCRRCPGTPPGLLLRVIGAITMRFGRDSDLCWKGLNSGLLVDIESP
jgi:hypothetical protein